MREGERSCAESFTSLGICVARVVVCGGFDAQRCIQGLGGVEDFLEDDLELEFVW